ncbi:site-2 protease family protein [Synechococcus elongatus]|uniref:Site-2 protease family protein n=1 Tax=Synechococcus elongatus PCC 11801 TaxID=2219813 RepID=A0AAN1QM40_SYNEL|nr:site-2 protease family protein [Synechococcus elongatus]AZB71875.1 site-2 protease family protein [Synechococcus elongatus PCC 11801]
MPLENATPILLLVGAIALIGWGFWRRRGLGRLGTLASLQSLALVSPWLIFFGLSLFGIYLRLTVVLVLLVSTTVVYILLGRQIRQLSQDPEVQAQLRDRLAAMAARNAAMAPDRSPDSEADTLEGDGQPHPLPADDLQQIKGIFGVDTFFATETIPYQEGAIFKGNLRGEATVVQPRLAQLLQERLDDRYRLFLINDPSDRPAVVVLPSTACEPPKVLPAQYFLAVLLAGFTLWTCFVRGAEQLYPNFDILLAPERLKEAAPLAIGLAVLLGSRELAHRWMADRYQARLSPPYFLPSAELGGYGAYFRLQSILRNRTELFDIAAVGPVFSGGLSLLALILGLIFTSQGGGGWPISSQVLQGSVLVGLLARAVLGTTVQQTQLLVHPLVIVGWTGLVINALNLIPIGQLSGGRLVQSVYGRKIAGRVGTFSLLILAIAAFTNVIAFYWGILVLLFQRQPERPSAEELSEPDDTRAAICLLLLFLAIAVLLPLTPSLAGRLSIGL